MKIREGKRLALRLTGSDKIGIVPEGMLPCYCESRFPEEKILDFMNLPFEKRAQYAQACVWRPEPQLYLL